jgi:NAD-dependent dihydropyrimidine dehydrogenase PreA subunit
VAYTGRKLNEYIWIPKSKTDLREFREILKICNKVEMRDGFFNDRTIGEEMVSSRAIVDRDNTAKTYIKKYQNKKISDQSYVSNARMILRLFRWLGFASKDYNSGISAKFYLTPYGKFFVKFHGPISEEELSVFRDAFANIRFFSSNDDIRYRNKIFKQRCFLSMMRFLDLLDYASHYELALSSLVLKNETKTEIKEKLKRIQDCRKDKSIAWLMSEYGLDCKNKSTITGIYDGPKVLLSFAKQMGLVKEIDLKEPCYLDILNNYKKMYKNSGQISEKSIKKISQITELGKQFIKKYKDIEIVWFDQVNDKEAALLLLCIKNKKVSTSLLEKIKLNQKNINNNFFVFNKDKVSAREGISFDLYRDVPYENRKNVIKNINIMSSDYFESDEIEDNLQYFYNEEPNCKCIECFYGKCAYYRDRLDAFGGQDRFPSRVCPENILKFNKEGILEIDEEKCVGCGLCLINCPFGSISYNSNFKFIKNSIPLKLLSKFTLSEKEKLTNSIETKSSKERCKIEKKDIPGLVNNFILKINSPSYKWDKDRCYTYVRNIFRLFGVNATYSGSGGMKTRSDVTIESPFKAVSEIKSPAESPINLKAVRQAIDASVQAGTRLTMAIGLSTHKGAIEQEEKYGTDLGRRVLLLEIKYLSFISFLSQHISFSPESLERLISQYYSLFNKEKLEKYLLNENKLCESVIDDEEIKDLIEKTFK